MVGDEELGPCPLCGRAMVAGPSVNEHHPLPRSLGGREKVWMHVVCHAKIHSLFTERELEKRYHCFEALREHEEIRKFVRWIRRRPPTFRSRHRTSRSKGPR